MKRFFLFTNLFILCLVMGFSAHATDVGGLITEDTTWTKANSPYVVILNVTVIEDVTLTIEPGVEVKFDKDKALLIDGTLIARGTSDDKIIFTSNGAQEPGYWGFISFSDTSTDATFDPDGNWIDGCILQHTTVEYGGSGQPVIKISLSSPFIDNSLISQNVGNGISITKGSPVISNSEIKNNSGSGIYSDGDADTTLTIDNCIISNNSNRGIYASSGTVTIQNSTISDNSASGYGGGIYASGTITVSDSNISGNSANNGGGIYLDSGTLTIQNSTISGNSANYYGGGIYASGTLTVSDSNISNNFTDHYYGGGIYLDSGTLTIQNSTISGNSADDAGGGIDASGTLTVQNSTISDNSASGYGGGIYTSGTLTIQNSTISGNSADYYGGGIYVSGTLTIQNSTISGNSAGSGGGIKASGTITIEGNTFTDNSANNSGGAINAGGTVTINNNVFNKDLTGNSAPVGGAIAASGTVIIQGNTIIQNTASDSFGGVVRLDVSADSIIGGDSCEYANLIKDNTGDGVYIKGNPAFNHNDVYNNTGFSLICGNASGAPDIDATNNYWGTDNEAVVKAVIWDGLDDPNLGIVNYNPFLTAPCKPDDTIPPAAVTDLATSDPTANSITLTWTAPGDDGNEGQAKTYDIRYSTSDIADENWDSATQCTGEPPPKPAGEPEEFIVTGLSPGTTYCFAMKTADEVPNWSELSNVAWGTTLPGLPPTVTGVNPSSRGQGAEGQNIVVAGADFVSGADVSFSCDDIEVNSTTFVSSTELIANIDIDDEAPVGLCDVIVTNPDTQKGTGDDMFGVNAKPAVISTNPDSLPQGSENQVVVIEGSGFVDNLPGDPNGDQLAADFGDGITVNYTIFVSSTEVIANISIAEDADVGARDVTVVNGDAGVGVGYDIFTVVPPCPITVISNEPVALSDLRQFRDNLLTKNETGQKLIQFYYRHSSEVASILLENPMLSIRSAAILKDAMPGIRFLLGKEEGRDMVMTPFLVARIKKLFEDIGEEGGEELVQSLKMLSDLLEKYEGMFFSHIWQAIDKNQPKEFALLQNHPNPFNPDTWIPYQLSESAEVWIRIYNVSGKLVRTLHLGAKPAGFYLTKDRAAHWDGKDDFGQQVASGVYYYTLRAGSNFSATRKMVIMK